MMRVEGDRLYVTGAATIASASGLLEAARAPLAGGVRRVDLGEVTELDSSLLAVLIAWMREARAQGRPLEFSRLPEDLKSLARLYGVSELLPEDTAA